MIDSQKERLIPLAEAAVQVPGRRPGQSVGVSTLYRWIDLGVRGVRLESMACGGTLCTTAEAIQRFFEGVTEARRSGRPAPTSDAPTVRTEGQRRRDSEAAAKRLDALTKPRSRRTGREATAKVN